jgi:hypothetical protein
MRHDIGGKQACAEIRQHAEYRPMRWRCFAAALDQISALAPNRGNFKI